MTTETTNGDRRNPDFTGKALVDLVVGIESVIGGYKAGNTKLGATIIRICEDACEEDERRKP